MPPILAPVFVQVLITFYLLARIAASRTSSAVTDPTLLKRGALDANAWPEQAQKFANCYRNQFELPVLFYLAVLLWMTTGGAGPVMLGLAWTFVALRIIHMLIHTGSNNVRHRFYAFAAGMLAVLAMWVVLAVHLIT